MSSYNITGPVLAFGFITVQSASTEGINMI